jgi:DNA-binding transcriptional MerR regulator
MASRQELRVVPDGGERERTAEPGSDSANQRTIEALSRETGMTVRNIRAHQARGLLPPPEVRMRVGYYGPEHVARLKLIQELQADGFNLKGIKRLLQETHGTAERFLGFKHAIEAPFATEEPQVFTLEELTERFAEDAGPEALEKAQRLGALIPLGDDRFEAPSPSLLDAAEEAMAAGIPLHAALSTFGRMRRACESVARTFVELFMEEVWKPFERAGFPEERWSDIGAALEALRPLASKALLATFQQTMTGEVERTFGRELERRWSKR